MFVVARKAAGVFVTSLLGAFLCLPVSASPLFPGVSASRSANGRFLVVVRLQFHDPDATSGVVTGATFEVMPVESQASRKAMAFTPHQLSTPIPLSTHGRSQSPVRKAH
jgi:hypothetical protein